MGEKGERKGRERGEDRTKKIEEGKGREERARGIGERKGREERERERERESYMLFRLILVK